VIATLCNRPERAVKSTFTRADEIPLPMLFILAGSAIDLDFNHSRPARTMRVEFESRTDEWTVSKWFWRNLRKCAFCLKRFDFDRHDKRKYCVAVDSVGIHFLHRSCAATLKPFDVHVLVEGYQYPDTQHFLTVDSRGYAPRVVIGNTRSTTRAALREVLREIVSGEMILRPPADGEVIQ
jgi:hypothetical protein